jgi:hypothetical protein
MITGAMLILGGILIGYGLSYLRNPFSKESRFVRKLLSPKAKIIDTSPDVDLGE